MIKIIKYEKENETQIFSRGADPINVSSVVSEIINNVKVNKDSALKFYCEKFDKVILNDLEVSKEEIDEAYNLIDKKLLETITLSAAHFSFKSRICAI